ncbi:MAG TPA: peptidoglycan DD-metalloendopeptidase family protein [Ramlibacter sp.]|jgi:lipoprotein NlpD|nr:peptidoglycan DD-metalloendopeptidase family protein [Ramlibacter sp.]
MRTTENMWRKRALNCMVGVLAGALLAGCASPRRTPAPVEDRGSARPAVVAPEAARTPAPAVASMPGAENAGKPGFHTVQRGETLIRIALENGQNWRDIARWNNLDDPNRLEVGQVLRVAPPTATATAAAPAVPPASAAPPVPAASAAASASRAPATAAAPAPAAASSADEEVGWGWPTAGGATVLAGFDEQKNKGIDIGGRAGDPVVAAADGRVVYAGAGLRGYGNLIILKHNNTYLTAYAHNQSLLVKEDQTVRKGQKIAEMGSTDSDRVKLHFEIRRLGKPVDPTRYLPPR